MSQTVKKLREAAVLQRSPLLHSAADEIERLRGLLVRAESEMAYAYWCAEGTSWSPYGDGFHKLWTEIRNVLGLGVDTKAHAAQGEGE